jgi:A/G-specific adenine glycosylase
MSEGSAEAVARARAALLAWYAAHPRPVPWRGSADPYAIWVSEVMLQQTRAATVGPYYERWLTAFPTVFALAAADLDEVLKIWQGLGYYARARGLHQAARQLVADYDGALPRTAAQWRALPGVGAYTAGAVASIAFGERTPAVDGNVTRVLCRWAGLAGDPQSPELRGAVTALAGHFADCPAPGDVNQALMDLGATVCTPTAPACLVCPLSEGCVAHATGRERLLPETRQRARPRLEHCFAVVARRPHDERRLVARRPTTGLLGGLWEFPLLLADPAAEAVELAKATFGLALCEVTLRPSFRHVFTHIDRRVTPVVGDCLDEPRADAGGYAEWRWVTQGEMAALPVSEFMRKAVRAVG